MAEMLVQSKSLTNIADKIRVLSGTTEQLGLDDMVTNVNEANNEIDSQADLLAQVAAALEGKAAGGGFENEDAIIDGTLSNYFNDRVTTIRNYAFARCTNLISVNFPACTTIDSSAFYNCSNLTTVSFPKCTSIGENAFYKCSNLTTVNFPVCTTIGNYVFDSCYQLTTITLGASIICTLSNSNAFKATKITSTTGSIFVPASLVSSYKAATNWTYFADRIFAIEVEGLITFTIGNITYQAVDGMTWTEWCNSEYNTGGYYIDEYGITNDGLGYIYSPDSVTTRPASVNSIIIEYGYRVGM